MRTITVVMALLLGLLGWTGNAPRMTSSGVASVRRYGECRPRCGVAEG